MTQAYLKKKKHFFQLSFVFQLSLFLCTCEVHIFIFIVISISIKVTEDAYLTKNSPFMPIFLDWVSAALVCSFFLGGGGEGRVGHWLIAESQAYSRLFPSCFEPNYET